MKTSSNKHLCRTLLCALFAGVIAAPFAAPTAYALPVEGAHHDANAGAANIAAADKTMDIVGKTDHNVLKWEDFSVGKDEKVRFDGGNQTRDYLNLVTGEGASNIYGTIEGGRNVYLVNPHGILFAEGSQVNTGAFYLSTAKLADVNVSTFGGGSSPLSASTQMGDVLNLGTVKTAKLYIEGKNVKVLNTDAVTDVHGTALTGANVKIRSEETPHIGYDVGNRATANFDESGGSVSHSFYDYANPNTAKSASTRGWVVQNLGGTAHTDYDYMRVHDVYDLQNINAKRAGRYILAKDIDATATTHWNSGEGFAPLGNGDNVFTGRFDGVGHTITALHIRWDKHYIGLFGYAGGARIENLSLKNAHVEGAVHTGGIVGYADSTMIRNVSYAGGVVGNQNVGGIAGDVSGGSIQNAWNAGTVSVRSQFLAGGIVGKAMDNAVIQNVCNTGAITGRMYIGGIVGGTGYNCTIQNAWNTGAVTGSELIGGIVGGMQNDCIVQNVWNTGTVTGNQKVGGIVGEADGGSIRHAVWKTGSAGQAVGALSNGADVTTDVKVAHEAQMKQAATYTDWKDEHGNAVVATEGGKGTPWRIYEGHTMPLLTGLMKGTKRLEKTYDGNVFATTDPHITLVHPGKDVGTYDAYSDQLGYNLIGGAVIKSRVLTLSGVAAQSKTYDGTTSADAAQFHATLNNVVAGEESLVTATATGAAYNSKDVRAANAVKYTGVALTGTGAGNYSIARTAEGTGTITPRALTLGTVAAQTKTYDGNTSADAAQFSATLGNVVAGEENSVTVTATGATYNSKNVAAASTIDYTGVALSGAEAGNYTLAATTAQGAGTITKRALTVGTVTAQSKTYDGTRAADASKFSAALGNAIAGDSVTATATGAAYNDHNVAAARTIDYTGVSLGGSDAGNYSLAATAAQGEGRITPKELNLALANGARFDKTYDGRANVTQSLMKGTNYTLAGFITGEGADIELSAVTGKYADKNAARDKAVTFGGLTLTGTGAGNYVLNKTALTGTGTISQKSLTLALTGGAHFDKTYDGNANVTQTLTKDRNYALTNFVNGEGADIALAPVTGTYTDKNAGTGKAVTFGGLTLTGTGAGNYVLNTSTLAGTGTIAHRDLTLTADAQSIVQGEALPSFTGRANGFAAGEDASVFGVNGITFGTTATNTDRPSRYDIIGRIGGMSDGVVGNYRIGQAAGNARAFTVYAAVPGGILASLVQNAAPRFDMGFEQEVYVFGLPRPIPTATLGIYRFRAARDFNIEGLRLD